MVKGRKRKEKAYFERAEEDTTEGGIIERKKRDGGEKGSTGKGATHAKDNGRAAMDELLRCTWGTGYSRCGFCYVCIILFILFIVWFVVINTSLLSFKPRKNRKGKLAALRQSSFVPSL